MHAIVCPRYGSPDVLELRSIEAPAVLDDQVRVRVHAAALNAADELLMTGEPFVMRAAFGLRRPRSRVPGLDVAGVVESVGERVEAFRPGDAVFGEVAGGAFAELLSAPAAKLAPMPSNLSFEQAAALPLAGITALQGLRDAARLQRGQAILIHGASGGVGTFAVQLARQMGAHVTGVCSTRNASLVRDLGAHDVVDYTREDITQHLGRYDVMFDLVGDHPLGVCRRLLKRRGAYVSAMGRTGGRWLGVLSRLARTLALKPFVSQRLVVFAARSSRDALLDLKARAEAGQLEPAIDAVYDLREVPDAMRHLITHHARGKIVIRIR